MIRGFKSSSTIYRSQSGTHEILFQTTETNKQTKVTRSYWFLRPHPHPNQLLLFHNSRAGPSLSFPLDDKTSFSQTLWLMKTSTVSYGDFWSTTSFTLPLAIGFLYSTKSCYLFYSNQNPNSLTREYKTLHDKAQDQVPTKSGHGLCKMHALCVV